MSTAADQPHEAAPPAAAAESSNTEASTTSSSSPKKKAVAFDDIPMMDATVTVSPNSKKKGENSDDDDNNDGDDGENKFTEQELRYFRKMFDMFDTDRSGAIGFFEMKNLTKHLGVEMSDEELKKSMDDIDDNGNGDLEFEEFVQWLSNANHQGDQFAVLKSKIRAQGTRPLTNQQIEQLHDVFKHFDADGSGSIDVEELGGVFEAMGQSLTPEELKALMDQVDDDGSGEMEFDEFLLLMCSNFGSHHSFDQELLEGFRKYDPTQCGMLSCGDLAALIKEFVGPHLTEEEVMDVVDVAHTRGDGFVEYMKWETLWEACRGIA